MNGEITSVNSQAFQNEKEEYSDCQFSMAINKTTGFIAVICSRHESKERYLSDICVKRLLSIMNDYNSPFGSMLLRAQGRDSSQMKFKELDKRDA